MDKQLTFCYRRRTDHGETGDADRPCGRTAVLRDGTVVAGAGPDPAVAKRINRGDADW